jgi:dTDP-glucose 4,6-dehydratase
VFSCILITGGAGFIGSNFVRFVLRNRPTVRVINLDVLSYSGNLENLCDSENDSRYRFVHGSICDAALVGDLVRECDAVINFAAETHVDRSILDPLPFVNTNVMGTQILLESIRQAGGSQKYLQVSTDEAYGSLSLANPAEKFTETSPLQPNVPYAATKTGADLLVRSYHRTFGLHSMVTRCSNNFGPYQFPEKLIPLAVTNLLEGKKVPLYGDGKNVRDWLYVEDHCEALLTVLERGRAGEVYNIGGNNERSNFELVQTILKALGKSEDQIEFIVDRRGHDRRYAIDATKIRSELGWLPSRSSWPGALIETVKWYTSHEDWWRRIKSGEYARYYAANYNKHAERRTPCL